MQAAFSKFNGEIKVRVATKRLNSLIPRRRILLEKLTIPQAVKKFAAF
jgi:hypothetical protein